MISNSCKGKQIFRNEKVRRRIKKEHPKYAEYAETVSRLKGEGNALFKNNDLKNAFDKYSDALDLEVDTKLNAIVFANRALVSLKLENNGQALQDANNAIEWDPDYVKGYYRRACALLCLCKFEDALRDLEKVHAKMPNDAVVKEQIEKTKEKIKSNKNMWNLFKWKNKNNKKEPIVNNTTEEMIYKETHGLNLDFVEKELNEAQLESARYYKGPEMTSLSILSEQWIKDEIIEKMKKNIFIHKKYLLQLLYSVLINYSKEPSLIEIDVAPKQKFTIVGDIHGQFYDFLHIFEINGYPSETNPYLFIGDYVDRGPFSVEVMITLLCFKVLYPKHIYLSRGNHESRNLNKVYGFENEVKAKYDAGVYECFLELFRSLPLAHVINKKILVLHGGLFSQDGVTLEDIKKVDRFGEIPESGIMCELLWSDPSTISGRRPSSRGVGILFGPDVANRFLTENGLSLLIRSHEVMANGYARIGNVITVFSAPNYCDQMGNKAAIVTITGDDMEPKFVTYEASPHPNVPSMAFAGQWMFL